MLASTLAVAANASGNDAPHLRLRGGLFHRLHHLDPPNNPIKEKSVDDEWFDQRLDHFNALNTKTWKQRYFSKYD